MKYPEQAKWFMNAFWNEGAEGETENIWKCASKFMELDAKKKEGNELDEFWSHKFLESLGETLTVIQLREKLRKIDMDVNGKMALLEYLLFKYSKSVAAVINAPQGDNTEEIDFAQSKVQEAQSALMDVQQKLEDQKNALAAQKKAEEEAHAALNQQREAEAEVRKAEAELKAAVDELKAQEAAYANKCAELERKSKDSTAGQVSKNKAAAELAQLKQENPIPLRKAKLSQEAALRKVEKQRAEAEKRTEQAEALAAEAVAKSQEAEETTRRVEEALRDAEEAVAAATQLLEEAKKKSGTPHGSIWWMERELKEAQKYLPNNNQQMYNMKINN
jgi:chromosome segregation ATPase